ncbi:MAG TPA: MarR family transcriptional regulator [Acidimicrobiia bacterium]|nr:MarR family transcriptional regulator [Acidimicrobiia bacterium]
MARSGGTVGGEQLSRDVLRHLMGVMHAMKAHVAELAAGFDLTPSQLAALGHLDEPWSQRQLAESLHFDASNVTDIVDRLEARGLVVRTVDAHDRRVRRIVRTPEGDELRRKAFTAALATAPTVAPLSASEQRTLCDLLGKIAEPVELPF